MVLDVCLEMVDDDMRDGFSMGAMAAFEKNIKELLNLASIRSRDDIIFDFNLYFEFNFSELFTLYYEPFNIKA